MSDLPASKASPRATRPNMPGYGLAAASEGDGLLPWDWAALRLTRARNYFLATVTPGAAPRPHLMVVWGLWLDETFQFSTARESRKGKNLATNPACSVSIEGGEEAVIVEGSASFLSDLAARARFMKAYEEKYAWDMSAHTEPVYVVRPSLAFGLIEKTFTKSATRWTF
jgi:nitroimidazol reductase NimA-like FMN-containing flavoprotein (pyridoxamine 5'-phosphate oxidase superfamily)